MSPYGKGRRRGYVDRATIAKASQRRESDPSRALGIALLIVLVEIMVVVAILVLL